MSDGAVAPSLGDVVSAAAFVVALATAWLYVAGWIYAYAYFDSFRIPMLLAAIPREHLFVYGGLTIWKNPAAAIAVLVLVAILAGLCVRYRERLGRGLLAGILVVAVAVLFVFARIGGTHTAGEDAAYQRASDFVAYPRTVIELEGGDEGGDAAAVAAAGCARLMLATDEWVFLIVPRRDMPAIELNTLVLSAGRIGGMTISGQYTSCP